MKTGQQYKDSLKDSKLNLYYLGEKIGSITDHPAIKPHINAVAMTYDIAHEPSFESLATAKSRLTGETISYFTHLFQGSDDFINEAKLLRELSQRTGTCYQRCTGHDALNALYGVTYEIDKEKGTQYHNRLVSFLQHVQSEDLMCSSAITDAKGDRSLAPSKQADPDLYVHIAKKEKDGIIVRGAKVNQTGVVNSHEVIVMPTEAMGPEEKDYAVSFAMPTNSQGIVYVLGRQSNDTRVMEGGMDQGNPQYGVVGGEAMIIFDDLFVPWERVFLCGEYEFAGMLVERFASLHRQRYGACKAGVSDVLIGAVAALADYHGVSRASAIRDKLSEMVHLTETMYGCTLASSLSAYRSPSGVYLVKPLMAAVVKQNVSRFTYEINRLAHDIAGGFIATMPSEKDLKEAYVGKYIEKYYRAVATIPTENRLRLGRLIENMTSVSVAVEATHGAGSPQAQRMMILRQADLEQKKKLALKLAGIK